MATFILNGSVLFRNLFMWAYVNLTNRITSLTLGIELSRNRNSEPDVISGIGFLKISFKISEELVTINAYQMAQDEVYRSTSVYTCTGSKIWYGNLS